MEKQLTQEQANAAYRAMCELNNVFATIDARFPQQSELGFRQIRVREDESGAIEVTSLDNEYQDERYVDQHAFAHAYGIAD